MRARDQIRRRERPRGIVNDDQIRLIGHRLEGATHRVLPSRTSRNDADRLPRGAQVRRRLGHQFGGQRHHQLVDLRVRQEQRHAALESRLPADADETASGTGLPKRCPRPPAAMMAETNIRGTIDYRRCVRTARGVPLTGPGPRSARAVHAARATAATTIVHPVGDPLGIADAGRWQRRRVDRVVHDELDVAGFGPQASLLHHVAGANHGQRHDRQTRLAARAGSCPP